MFEPQLTAVQLVFELDFAEPIDNAGFIGSTLRGGFGYVFRRIACGLKRQKDCKACILYGKCVYSIIFESPVPSDASIMRKYPYSPHPFVFSYTNDTSCNRENAPCKKNIRILIIGKAIEYIPYFIYTIKEFGKTGFGKRRIPFDLISVYDMYGTPFYAHDEWLNPKKHRIIDHTSFSTQKEALSQETKITVDYLTPCRIKYNEHLVDSIEFHVLIRSLLRRISELSYFFCGIPIDADYPAIINHSLGVHTTCQNLKWIEINRYSTRQKQRMKLGGVVGTAVYEGDIAPFLPILLWGELLHVGKGTSFGLGEYRIRHDYM